ncbi:pyridoxamine 5'-phosphate oxidase family protein [Haladaptatus sp. GCM10025707]|uniref:pyridoxamine 5'-phosphate oxidase family protein n=1 Tax=unclassified Haladaptatus TaxID=2622732 RepID=UPI0023E78042|nr:MULTISPECIES: pyridoxamine 5'-phosphate oxidase family protein [unclassified Haladaptatus]
MGDELPGSDGEHALQERFGTKERALRFYEDSMHEELNEVMQRFIGERILFFLATADANGHTDCSPRLGPRGFVTVLDEKTLAYPEYRGNGVHASLGNIEENPYASLTFVDWWDTTVGLHVNGPATLHDELSGAVDPSGTDRQKVWVKVDVEEAYIHCAKHLPQLSIEEFDPPWGTDDEGAKRTDFFDDENKL